MRKHTKAVEQIRNTFLKAENFMFAAYGEKYHSSNLQKNA